MTQIGKWSFSTNQEDFLGAYDTREQAIEAAMAWNVPFWVGQCVAPIQPEELFDYGSLWDWLDSSVWQHDDYSHESAQGAVSPSQEQLEELVVEIRPLIAAWLDRHRLRPTHVIIDPVTVEKVETNHASSEHSGHPREDDSPGEDDPAAAEPQP